MSIHPPSLVPTGQHAGLQRNIIVPRYLQEQQALHAMHVRIRAVVKALPLASERGGARCTASLRGPARQRHGLVTHPVAAAVRRSFLAERS